MRAMVAIIAGIIILLRHYLISRQSQTRKPQWQDKNRNKAGCTVQEAMMSNSGGVVVLNDHPSLVQASGCASNSNAFDTLELRQPVLGNLMEALADPNTHLVGVYGSDDEIKATLLQRVYRRVQRDQLFGVVVTAKITKYPDVKKIQEDIACQLAFTFNHMSKEKRSKELIRRIKNEQSILIVLCDLQKALDLNNIGIPYGANHTGCKIILTSTAEDVLSHHMHTQTNFMV